MVFEKQRKVTRREVFLAEMARVVPWRRLEALIEPHYLKSRIGRLLGSSQALPGRVRGQNLQRHSIYRLKLE